jgi:hypothetical protein
MMRMPLVYFGSTMSENNVYTNLGMKKEWNLGLLEPLLTSRVYICQLNLEAGGIFRVCIKHSKLEASNVIGYIP